MDQKRLILAIAISLGILLGFQWLIAPELPHPTPPHNAATQTTTPTKTAANQQPAQHNPFTPSEGSPAAGAPASPQAVPKKVPRVEIAGQRVRGSISLLGARIDDLVLTHYKETLAPNSPDVRLLEPRSDPHPYYVQYGWSAPPGEHVKVPGNDTVWQASPGTLSTGHPVTLSWNNGAGLTFELILSVDDEYMFSVRQVVKNDTGQPVKLYPWSRVRRDYKPETSGTYLSFEGLLGVTDGTLQEVGYDKAKSEGEKKHGVAYEATSTGGWAGITDKYWLTAMVPDQAVPARVTFRHLDDNGDHYQVDYALTEPQDIKAGGTAELASHLFAGAKVVRLLDHYQSEYHIPNFDKAVDFGWFYFLTKPIFYALDFLNSFLGNFGLAILVFTVFVKALFFPLANYSYRSMSKMKLLAPKMQAVRERFKDDPQKMQQEMMAMYRAEKVNPASGCLPMIVQIPVFYALYKNLYVTIEMRQAPFYGWIHDLSAVDPTNVFNLFGLLPFDPATISPFLHLGAWPLIMGFTMFLQQKMNPAPPDPVQAKMFMLMPIVFTFMLAHFPAGLVIYWSWNNLLSVAQQWLIQRQTRLARPAMARN